MSSATEDSSEQQQGQADGQMMTFGEHLEELRSRLKKALLAVVIGACAAYAFSDLLFALLAQPLIKAWADAGLGSPQMHFANPIEPFFTYLKLSLLAGVFIGSPVVFYQLWSFISPGLYQREKRYVIPFATISALCFIGGACFGYFIVFPYGFQFFLSFARDNMGSMKDALGGYLSVEVGHTFKLQPTLMMSEYFGLVWRLLLAFGLVFELPLLICFLAMAGLVTHRTLWKWNPYFVVVSFIISAVLTPPDVITQVFMAGPLIALYNLSIAFAWLFARRRAKRQAASAFDEPEEAETDVDPRSDS